MAGELTLSFSLVFAHGTKEDFIDLVEAAIDAADKPFAKLEQTIGITQEALLLGDVSTPGFLAIVNDDDTNYVELKTALSGTVFCKLFPGEGAVLRLGSGAQAPAAIANTAPVDVRFLLVGA